MADPLILTPNASLAQQLRRRRLKQQNTGSSQAANIHVLPTWLALSAEGQKPWASDVQLRYLWEQTIQSLREQHQNLQQLNPGYLAQQALSAWRHVKQWQIDSRDLMVAETGQLLSFSQWINDFESRLAATGLTTLEMELSSKIAASPSAGLPQKQGSVQLYAFIEPLAPLWRRYLEHRFEQIDELGYMPDDSLTAGVAQQTATWVSALDSPEQEIEAAFNWAQQTWQAAATDKRDPPRIAIIDVNLSTRFKPHTRRAESLFSAMGTKKRVRFSRELPLVSQGPVLTAMNLLQLNKTRIPLATARQVLHSPLWGNHQANYDLRAQWDTQLCAMQAAEVNISDFLALPSQCSQPDMDENGASVESELADIFVERWRNKTMMPLAWCDMFQQQLEQLGCFEHFADHQWHRWVDTLSEFARLGSVSGHMDIDQALQQLAACCSLSSPKVSTSGPGITIMDTVEAAADYSHIWVLGMDSTAWPGATKLNPLLPVSIQVQYKMPHSQPQMEADLSRKLVERLKLAAGELIFSYSKVVDDIEQSPCAYIRDLPPYPLVDALLGQSPVQVGTTQFEWIDCASAPEVPTEQRTIRSGASLLKTMAQSPFDAFVQWRLGAYELDSPKVGLSALDRGNLLHHVLESIWNQLQGSDRLTSMNEGALEALCHEVAEKQLQRFQARHGWLKQGFVELEIQRLAALTADWLNIERERPGFQVELTEESLMADIAGLRFTMRLDRLDRLDNGQLLLIDYKTGQGLSRRFWLEMPPTEPQLPLYALTLNQAPDALCFAKVRADKMEFIGIGSDDFQDIKGIQPIENWAELIQDWRDSLESLAQDYIRGDTRIFEASLPFGATDPLAPLHRLAEFEPLTQARKKS